MKRDLLLPKVAGIFKILYDEDILDEEVHIQKLKSVIIPQRNQSPKFDVCNLTSQGYHRVVQESEQEVRLQGIGRKDPQECSSIRHLAARG